MVLAYIKKGSLAGEGGEERSVLIDVMLHRRVMHTSLICICRAISSIPDKIGVSRHLLKPCLVKRSQHDREIGQKQKPFHYCYEMLNGVS